MLHINIYDTKNNQYRSRRSVSYASKTATVPQSVSFSGHWYAETLANKYAFIKNYEARIAEEALEMYSLFSHEYNELFNDTVKLIEKKRAEFAAKDTAIANFPKMVEKINSTIKIKDNENTEIIQQIHKTNTLSAVQSLRLSKLYAAEKRKNQVISSLKDKYVMLHNLEKKKYPNAFMIIGLQDAAEKEDVLQYLFSTNNLVSRLDFGKILLPDLAKTFAQTASKIKESGKQTLLMIDNFDRYTVPNEANFAFINKLKQFLSSCSSTKNTTVLVFENNPSRLDRIVTQGHRFTNIDVSHIKSDKTSCFVPKYDGFTFVYDTKDKDFVDLYLGSFGYDKSVLWIDSCDDNKIRTVINRIDEIKKQDLFKFVEKAEFAQPDNAKNLDRYITREKYTQDCKLIYEWNF